MEDHEMSQNTGFTAINQQITMNTANSNDFPGGMVIDGHAVNNTETMISRLEASDITDVYDLALECYDKLSNHHDKVEDGIARLYDFVRSKKLWEGRETHQEFQDRWEKAIKIHTRKERDRREIDRIRIRAIDKWGNDNAIRFFSMINTRSLGDTASKLIKSDLSYEDLRTAINNQVLNRLRRPGKGIPNKKRPLPKDFERALLTRDLIPLRATDLIDLELQINQDGFVCPDGEGIDLIETAPDIEPESRSSPDVASLDSDKETRDTANAVLSSDVEMDEAESSEDDSSWAERSISGEPDDASGIPAGKEASPEAICECKLSASMVRNVFRVKEPVSRRAGMVILRKIGRRLIASGGISVRSLCKKHASRMVEILHMRKDGKSHQHLIFRIQNAYSNLGRWNQFVQDNSQWFTFRPETEHYDLALYAHRPLFKKPLIANFAEVSSWLSIDSLLRRIYAGRPVPDIRPWEEMRDAGSTILPDMYSWFGKDFDGEHPNGIWPLIHSEYRIYDYHMKPDAQRLGWQRNMWFSLIQQLIRQDPAYYMAYVFFRSDHAYRMVSYPYYTKNTKIGENTTFRHIDINVQDHIDNGRGDSILQGSVSLTQEDTENCTEILAGMHRPDRLSEWWNALKERDQPADGYVHSINNWMWRPEDAETYGCDWVSQVCGAGDVRLSQPTLPHGSRGPATTIRRTVLPWFVGVQDDHETLDTAESNTWSEISIAHRDQMNASKTPSGLSSTVRGRIPFRFPASVSMHCKGAVSSCLIAQSRWDQEDVRRELDILFGRDEEAAIQHIRKWRVHALKHYVYFYQKMRANEVAAYGTNSFFDRIDKGILEEPDESALCPAAL